MNKDIELSQLKQMLAPIGRSPSLKAISALIAAVLICLAIFVVFMTVNGRISIILGLVLALFIGALIGGLFIGQRLLFVAAHQAKYLDQNKVKSRITEIET